MISATVVLYTTRRLTPYVIETKIAAELPTTLELPHEVAPFDPVTINRAVVFTADAKGQQRPLTVKNVSRTYGENRKLLLEVHPWVGAGSVS